MNSRDGLLTTLMAVAAIALMAVGTLVQGWWTERWGKRHDQVLAEAASRLERSFPATFGEWRQDRELETSRAELDKAGAVGSISRVYRNEKTKTAVSAFIVCATAPDASKHTPQRCYPAAGFEIDEGAHRETIPLRDGRVVEAFTGTFKRGETKLRVFWTYGIPDKKRVSDAAATEPAAGADGGPADPPRTLAWVAPQIARIALNEFPAVYKLYVIIDQSKMPSTRATAECSDFLAESLPAFDAALAAGGSGSSLDEGRSAPAAEPAPAPADATAG